MFEHFITKCQNRRTANNYYLCSLELSINDFPRQLGFLADTLLFLQTGSPASPGSVGKVNWGPLAQCALCEPGAVGVGAFHEPGVSLDLFDGDAVRHHLESIEL